MADVVQEMKDFEAGFMDADDAVRLFQELVDKGIVWRLDERYQRIARALLEAGMIFPPQENAPEEEAFEDPALWFKAENAGA
ncbi:MAG: hypothetical protein AB1425_07495 [Actinomycetota bacterium]